MQKFARYLPWIIIILYFVLGAWVLISDRFNYLSKEMKYIFAVFLFLYGGFRLARLWSKYRSEKEE